MAADTPVVARVIVLTLSYPPSVNTLWRNIIVKGKPRTLLSAAGRAYRLQVAAMAILIGAVDNHLPGAFSVSIMLYPPDKRRRDIDNPVKAILDGLTYAGIWEDDSQVDVLMVQRCAPEKPGRAVVTLRHGSDHGVHDA